mgnify:FL=1
MIGGKILRIHIWQKTRNFLPRKTKFQSKSAQQQIKVLLKLTIVPSSIFKVNIEISVPIIDLSLKMKTLKK